MSNKSTDSLIGHLNDLARERESKPTSAKSMRDLAKKIKQGAASKSELNLAKKITTGNK